MQYVKSKTVVILGSTGKLSDGSVAIKKSNTSLKKELHTDVQGERHKRDDPPDEERQTSENAPRLKSSLKKKISSLDGSTLEQVSSKRAGVGGSSSGASEGSLNGETSKMGATLEGGKNEGDESSADDDRNTDGGGNTDAGANSGDEQSADKPKGAAKGATKKVSVFQRLATTHTLSSSYRRASPKLKKLHTENLQAALKGGGPKKAFSMKVDKNVTYSSFAPYNKARKINAERKLNMIRAKTQILKIAERFMSTEKIKSFQMVERRNTQSLARGGKPHSEMEQLEREEKLERLKKLEKTGGRKPGDIPIPLRGSSTKHGDLGKANQKNRPTLRKHKKMVLQKTGSQQGLPLFENMLGVSHSGGVYTWDGYQWRKINILYEYFVSLCTDKKGHILCINTDFKPGFLMSNRCFQKIDTHREALFLKMAISGRNKMWAINLRGDLQKWDKYEWVQEKKAYGIAKLKSLAFDRSDRLWVLDEKNYFYIYHTERKNWMLHSDSSKGGGGNINDFDFNESNFLVALTSDGMIKFCRNGRWVRCGMLGQVKISSLHFSRRGGG
ncbi:conserved Plasmodium protein, unknown function [Plasmodium vivax]|uniref:Uncharacterized protein n=2 Tax=Plasmodium vivax TaxID=5855 RepID=A0A1G4HE63_PLAVI|nr:hypothetical protein PVIIG_01981 [Plasmodium vivax India VII]SCO73180.1 conserved Plasmodium protein, unknown function [Plasmodium vivax]VUZ96474.1 conserved Plasmodium protein, unknown function [Plasmodium vivax]